MPIMNSMGSLKIQRNNQALPVGSNYWLSVVDLKMPANQTNTGRLITYNDDVYVYGNESSSTLFRPYYTRMNQSDGSLLDYNVFQQVTGTARILVTGMTIDTNSNLNLCFYNSTRLYQYDTSGNLIQAIDFTSNAWTTTYNYVTNYGGYLYILSLAGTSTYITKINQSTYSVVSCIRFAAAINVGNIFTDSVGNVFLVLSDGTNNTYMKLDSSLNFLWSKQYASSVSNVNTTVIDSFGNLYSIVDGNKMLKIDPNGTVLLAYTLTGGPSAGYARMSIMGNTLIMASGGGAVAMALDVMDTSLTPIRAHNVSSAAYSPTLSGLALSPTYTYMSFNINSSGTLPTMVLKLPISTILTTSTPYNFTITFESGTPASRTFTSTLNITTRSVVTTSVTSVSLTPGPSSPIVTSITATSATPAYNVQTLFSYYKPLV